MIKKNLTVNLTLGFLGILIFSTLSIGIIAFTIFKGNIYEFKKENMTTHAISIADKIGEYNIEDLKDNNFINAMELLNLADNSNVWIVKKDGSIIAMSHDSNINGKFTYIDDVDLIDSYGEIIENALNGHEDFEEIYNSYYSENMLVVAVPIKNNTSINGAVVLNTSNIQLQDSMDKFFVYLILTLLGAIILAGAIGYYFSKHILRPIKKLNESALELARGHYGIKTNIYQDDEIGELSSTFDLLSLKLKYTVGKLFEEKDKLSNIITSMNEGIIALDGDLKFINVNISAKALILDDITDNSLNVQSELTGVLEKMGVLKEFKNSIKTSDKVSFVRERNNKVLEFSVSPIKNDIENIIGGVILIQDISEKSKLEQMRKDFVSNVSHEFRTPLTVIKGNLESIIDGITKKDDIEYVCINLIKETDRLERMVKDLLNLSRLDAGKIELNISKLDVNMLISDTIRNLRPLIRTKQLKIDLDLGEDLPPLLSDYDKLKQVIIIFLDNAIKFSSQNGDLKIKTYIDNKKIFIEIRDYGIGIDKDEIENLGEKFYKVDKTRSCNVGGTGLGLSIAKRLINVLNGKFTIESELGKGTIVTVSFDSKETT